jgi:serine/threonine protein kinase
MTPDRWLQVKEIFQEAAELGHEGGRALLLERCNGDPEMLRELELLLESHHDAEEFIERPALCSASDILSGGEANLWMGRTVGQYRVLREIGRGGMGLVLLAVRADDQFEKQVAIKILRRGMDSEDIVRRFRNERQILASLEHPYIARLFDGGMTDDGLPYFVMEYIEGQPLDKYADAQRLNIKQRLEMFRKVCEAVQYAHQNLVVHRDLKPSNILITPTGVPKLLDFGIAKVLSSDLSSSEQTRTETRMMTPEYASPEQVRAEKLTTRSDVYSLGVVLYELLTGRRPYRASDTAPYELARLICEQDPAKPSMAVNTVETIERVGDAKSPPTITPESISRARDTQPDKLRHLLSGDLDNIVLMALRKEQERRYESAEQLSADIQRYLYGLPIIAHKDTFAYRASKFVRRNRIGVAAASLVFLAIFAGLTISVWQARVAARERNQARRERAKADQLNNFLKSILSAAGPEQKGRDVKVIEVLSDAAARIDEEFANQPELKAQALQTIGQTYVDIGLMDEAEKPVREALRMNLELYGEENKATTMSRITLGVIFLDKGKLDEAEKLLNEAVITERRLSPSGSKELALGLFALGELYIRRHANKEELEKAKQMLLESVSISDNISGENNEDSAYTLISLARAEEFSGDSIKAEATYRKSIAIFRGLPQRYETRMALALFGLGHLLSSKGNHDEAINAMLEASRIFQKQGESWGLFMSQYYLCQGYYNKGDYAKAVEEGAKAVGVGRKVSLTNTPDFAYSLTYLGLALTRTNRAKEGEPLLRESLDRLRINAHPDVISIAAGEGALGECLSAQARYSEAEPLLLESYESLKNSQAPNSPRVRTALERLTALYENWKRPDRAAEYRSKL